RVGEHLAEGRHPERLPGVAPQEPATGGAGERLELDLVAAAEAVGRARRAAEAGDDAALARRPGDRFHAARDAALEVDAAGVVHQVATESTGGVRQAVRMVAARGVQQEAGRLERRSTE